MLRWVFRRPWIYGRTRRRLLLIIGEQQQDGDTISAVWGDVEHSLTWADRGNLTGTWATLSNTATWGDVFDG